MSKLCLASASPRRRELLSMLPVSFDVQPVNIEEKRKPNEAAADYVQRLALEKADAGLQRFSEFNAFLGSDTIVTLGDEVFEKPENFDHFYSMMQSLSGVQHEVMTAVAVVKRAKRETFSCTVPTQVEFRKLSEADIQWYWNTKEPLDKAGGYGIQGLGGRFIKRISGSYSAVVGLPLCETESLLAKAELLEL
ncbi:MULTISPECIES: nucleoside triphosphate pyrophosphatase [Gammaproteobacteria]|uniref:Maf family protein n=1 Tax=Gammaproteobacteria TaxID=1236 RepID=UPI000DD0214C|nr:MULTISPECIES: Maf family protein [Gammaproteobacteria]RTE86373.1 septum formation inhibitor Maf [Aliidiomarina sp. B3213]TCZ91721.1 septum formation inhibitor Maf [Lysobacter sp. N42]